MSIKRELKINQIVLVSIHNQNYVATIEKFRDYVNLDNEIMKNHFIELKNIFNIYDGQPLWIGKLNTETIFKNQILLILKEPI